MKNLFYLLLFAGALALTGCTAPTDQPTTPRASLQSDEIDLNQASGAKVDELLKKVDVLLKKNDPTLKNSLTEGDEPPPTSPTEDQAGIESPLSYDCSIEKTCGQMSSCAEAMYYLNTCGHSKRDSNDDGIPCESLCDGG